MPRAPPGSARTPRVDVPGGIGDVGRLQRPVEGVVRLLDDIAPACRGGGRLPGQPEAEAGIGAEAADGRGRPLASEGDRRLFPGRGALRIQRHGEGGRHQHRRREDGGEGAEPGRRPPLQRPLPPYPDRLLRGPAVPCRHAGLDQGELRRIEAEVRARRPGGEELQAAARQEEVGVAPRGLPVGRRVGEAAPHRQVVAGLTDPGGEAGPPAEERIVRDLHRCRPGHRVTIEGEEPAATELVQHVIDGGVVDSEPAQVRPGRRADRPAPRSRPAPPAAGRAGAPPPVPRRRAPARPPRRDSRAPPQRLPATRRPPG